VLIALNYKKGEIIVNEGDMANSFFIIKKGSVSAMKGTTELRKMQAGDSFGEQALF
jgi:cGMP-dependent protein kinase